MSTLLRPFYETWIPLANHPLRDPKVITQLCRAIDCKYYAVNDAHFDWAASYPDLFETYSLPEPDGTPWNSVTQWGPPDSAAKKVPFRKFAPVVWCGAWLKLLQTCVGNSNTAGSPGETYYWDDPRAVGNQQYSPPSEILNLGAVVSPDTGYFSSRFMRSNRWKNTIEIMRRCVDDLILLYSISYLFSMSVQDYTYQHTWKQSSMVSSPINMPRVDGMWEQDSFSSPFRTYVFVWFDEFSGLWMGPFLFQSFIAEDSSVLEYSWGVWPENDLMPVDDWLSESGTAPHSIEIASGGAAEKLTDQQAGISYVLASGMRCTAVGFNVVSQSYSLAHGGEWVGGTTKTIRYKFYCANILSDGMDAGLAGITFTASGSGAPDPVTLSVGQSTTLTWEAIYSGTPHAISLSASAVSGWDGPVDISTVVGFNVVNLQGETVFATTRTRNLRPLEIYPAGTEPYYITYETHSALKRGNHSEMGLSFEVLTV